MTIYDFILEGTIFQFSTLSTQKSCQRNRKSLKFNETKHKNYVSLLQSTDQVKKPQENMIATS